MEDFNKYFLGDRGIFLDNISYESVSAESGHRTLGCNDTVVSQLSSTGIKITFNRALHFEPEGPFFLSVTFGVVLVFNPKVKDEVDWAHVDIAGEFKKSCPQLLGQLMSRASLLVSQITSSAGQIPIVTPASPVMKGN